MPARPATAFVLLLASLVLAGCSAPPADEGTADGLRATAETGLVRGVVVDEAIRPVAGVAITLARPGSAALAAASDAEGRFGFDGLAPGSYVLVASKAGYLEATVLAEVRPDEPEPPVVQVLLERDAESTPYVEAVHFDGFIECGVRGGTGSIALCQFVEGRANVTDDRSQLKLAPASGPSWLQAEMLWRSTQPLADTMGFALHLFREDGSDAYMGNYPLNLGPSPLWLAVDGTGAGQCSTCVEPPLNLTAWKELWVTAFPGDLSAARPPEVCAPTGNPCTAGVGVVVEQRFDLFVHLFYRATPPHGWRFSADGSPPV